MDNLKLSESKLKDLKRKLPHGTISRIAEELGIHRNNVDMVFKGKFENQKVIDMALEILEEKKAQIKAIESKIDQVINS